MKLVLNSSEMSQWYTLVTEAESNCFLTLNQDVESYLIFLLIRFTKEPSFINSVLAIDFLEGLSALKHKQQQYDVLREVGDKCLLMSGLFPKRAERLHLTPSYFNNLGRCAYDMLSISSQRSYENVFSLLSDNFESLTDVMHAMRNQNKGYMESVIHGIRTNK